MSHQIYDQGSYEFKIIIEKNTNKILFKIIAPGRIKQNTTKKDDGTGFRYIKARLEESYKGMWSLDSYKDGENWITEISIPNNASQAL